MNKVVIGYEEEIGKDYDTIQDLLDSQSWEALEVIYEDTYWDMILGGDIVPAKTIPADLNKWKLWFDTKIWFNYDY